MKPVTQELLRQAAAAFDFGLPTGEAERYGAGHINDTFAVWAADHSRRWILQRINTDTFTDPAGLMENVTGVTSYLRREILARGGDPDRETLNVVPTREGKPYYTDCEGGAWRAYLFVEGTVCLQKVENERDFYTAAETFGNFQNQLAGYPAATLHETIARFHDTPNRYANFEKALAADVMGRAREIGPEIAFIRAREADCHVLMDQLAANPLKFILFIDDLSFASNDDNFAALKAILEGSAGGRAGNIAVYATSNRRHLVKETFTDRAGDDLHEADTRQELMSLSARFGLIVTFQRPDKALYSQILLQLAKQYQLPIPSDQLITRGEAFAIRAGGRSPRAARQFIEQCRAGVL